jgi:hypothetical protein
MSFLSSIEQKFSVAWNDTNGEHCLAGMAAYLLILHWTKWWEALLLAVLVAFMKEVVMDKWIGKLTGYNEPWSRTWEDLKWWLIGMLIVGAAH